MSRGHIQHAAKPRYLQLIVLAQAAIAAIALSGCQQLKPYTSKWSFAKRPEPSSQQSPLPLAPAFPRQEQVEGKFSLARAVEQSAELDQAAAAYEDVIKSDRKHAAAHHRLAIVCDKRGKCDQADEHFRLALRQNPEDAELLCDFGYSLYLRGQFAEAETHLCGALSRAPGLTRAHNNLGLLLARTGRVAESIPHFQAAGGSPAQARANAAFALMLDERWPEAHEQLIAALTIDPNCALAGQRLREVQAVLARTSRTDPGVNVVSHGTSLGPPPQVAALPPVTNAGSPAGIYSTR